MPPMVTSFFAVTTLFFILKTTRLQKYNTLEQTILLFLIILMPAFWSKAGVIHPEFMMTFFLSASIYYLGFNKSLYGSEFWKGIVLWGFAIGTKVTAVFFAPAVLGIIIWKWKNKEISFQVALWSLVVIGSVILVLFVICNPYLISPRAAKVWWASLQTAMISNATNHGLIGNVSLQEKIIKGVGRFFPLPLFIVLLISAIWFIVKAWKTKELTVNALIALFVITYTSYLLFRVNKNWGSYYLSPMLIGTPLIISAVKEIKAVKKLKTIALILLFAAVLIQGYSFGGRFIERIVFRMDDKMSIWPSQRDFIGTESDVVEKNELLRVANENADLIKPYVGKDTILYIKPYIISDYSAIGLTHNKVVTIWGPLNLGQINRSDLIVISKYSPCFQKDLSKYRNSAALQQKKQQVEGWMSGRGEFTLVDQNARLLIFQRKQFSVKNNI
jgi:hypothetical protein